MSESHKERVNRGYEYKLRLLKQIGADVNDGHNFEPMCFPGCQQVIKGGKRPPGTGKCKRTGKEVVFGGTLCENGRCR